MKNKKLKVLAYTLSGLVIAIAIAGAILYKEQINQEGLMVSEKTIDAANPNLSRSSENEYFELVGFGQLEINNENPYLNLINPSENRVYLSFDVIYNDKSIYKTKLIEPGKMEQYDIYSCLNAGEHTITYSIDVYDYENKKPLWTGIQQEQEIIVKS